MMCSTINDEFDRLRFRNLRRRPRHCFHRTHPGLRQDYCRQWHPYSDNICMGARTI